MGAPASNAGGLTSGALPVASLSAASVPDASTVASSACAASAEPPWSEPASRAAATPEVVPSGAYSASAGFVDSPDASYPPSPAVPDEPLMPHPELNVPNDATRRG